MRTINKQQIADMMLHIPPEEFEISDGYHTFEDLYQHRNLLLLAFLYTRSIGGNSGWRSKLHSDGSTFDGYFIAGTTLQIGSEAFQITYHLPDDLWGECYFLTTLDQAPTWDGHTPADVLERLNTFIQRY